MVLSSIIVDLQVRKDITNWKKHLEPHKLHKKPTLLFHIKSNHYQQSKKTKTKTGKAA